MTSRHADSTASAPVPAAVIDHPGTGSEPMGREQADGPLKGIRVFDLTHGGVGPWSTMLLAAMGANVVKVEAPGGDTIRHMRPRYQDLAAVYIHCNLGKRGVYLDLKSEEGMAVARQLLAEADVLAENMKWGTVKRLGLGYDAVAELNPRIVYGNCPGWGGSGPYRDRGSVDVTSQAFSGAASITGTHDSSGELIRWYALHDFNASTYIVTAVLLGLLHRERNGRGLRFESPQVAASLAVQTSRIAEFLTTGENPRPLGSGCASTVPHRAFLCEDHRWLAVAAETPEQWLGLCEAVGANELAHDERFAANHLRLANRETLEGRLETIFRTRPARWWTIQLQKRSVPVSLLHDHETIPDLPQVRANNCLVELDYPRVGRLPFANPPFQLSRTTVALRPGPWPGQNTEQVVREGWGEPGPEPAPAYFGPSGPMETGALDGVIVVDLSQGLCGPYASLLLADAGAKVLKIEPPEGDYQRQLGPLTADGVGAAYFHLNRNKEVFRLDLDQLADRERLIDLIRQADVLIEDSGRAVLPRLGLTDEELGREKPRLVHCVIWPQGPEGPLRDQPVAELQLQAMSGFLTNLGVPGEEPVRMGPDMGSLGAGVFAVVGILGALYHAWRTGQGQQVTLNMLGSLIHQRGVTWTSMINPDEWAGFYVEGAAKPPDLGYQAGDGPMVWGAPRDPAKMPTLLESLGMQDQMGNPLFQNQPRDIIGWGGRGDLPLLAKPIWEAGFQRWKREELVALLASFGCNAAPMNSYADLFAHAQTQTLGMLREVDDPARKRVAFLLPPWKLDGLPEVKPAPYREQEPATAGRGTRTTA